MKPRVTRWHPWKSLFVWLCTAGCVGAQGGALEVPAVHPMPAGVQGILYSDPAQTGRAARVQSIHRMVGFQNRLFVAVSDTAGHEILDVWDTRNATRPILSGSVDFGSVRTNGVMFTPLAMVPFPEGLLLQTRGGLALYRFQADGRLAWERDLPPTVTGLGLDLTQIHVAGRHGSLQQQVIPNPQITGANADAVHREVLLDLADPQRPKLLWTGAQGPSVTHKDPLNAVFAGHPASLAWDTASGRVRLTAFEPDRRRQQEVFWAPKVERLFAASALDGSLRGLLATAMERVPLATLQARGVRVHAEASGDLSMRLAERVRAHHADAQLLREVFDVYGIALDEPLEMAIAKGVGHRMDASLESRLGSEWYAAPLQEWLRTILAPGVPLRTAAEARAAVAQVFQVDLDEQSLARYLTLHVIGPLLGSPKAMEVTLGELIDQLAGSPAGGVIDVLLNTAGGYGALNEVLERLSDLVDLIPGVDLPRLPACVRFPESTRQLVDLALFSWNDAGSGRVLRRDGLAWFEFLKFHRYLTGRADLGEYTREIETRLRAMQTELAGQLSGRLSDAFALPEADLELPDLQARVAGARQARLLMGRLLAQALVDSVSRAGRFDAAMTTRAALAELGLHVRELGVRESTVADLVGALEAAGLGEVSVGDLHDRAAALPVALLAAQVEHVLRAQIETSFHVSDLDLSLRDLLRPCLDFDVGIQNVMGDWMSGLVGDLLEAGPGMSGLLLNHRRAFEHHDCIAGWLVALEAVGASTAWMGGDVVAFALEYALREGYQAAVSFGVTTLFGTLIDEVIGGFGGDESAWIAAQLAPRSWEWEAWEQTAGSVKSVMGAYAWQNRVVCVIQERLEADWFGPRRLTLVQCHPDDPVGTRRVHDLGRWTTVNYVHHHGGAVFVGGTYFMPGDGLLPSGKALLVDVTSSEPRVQRFHGDTSLALGSAPLLGGANHEACLAVGGLNQVYLLPNPAGSVAGSRESGTPARILRPPASVEVPAGDWHEFSLRTAGTAPLAIQWYKDGVPIDALVGGRQNRLRVEVTEGMAAAEYSVVVSNALGSASARATLAVLPGATLGIEEQPSDLVRFAGQVATFRVRAAGEGAVPLRYQWFHRGRPMAGATEASWSVPRVTLSEAGEYHVEVRRGDRVVASREARLVVVQAGAPEWLSAPDLRHPMGLGAPGAVSVTAVGWGDLAYRWFKGDREVSGAAGPVLAFGNVSETTEGDYRVEVIDGAGQVSARDFTVVLAAAARMRCEQSVGGGVAVTLTEGVVGQAYALLHSSDLRVWSVVSEGVFPADGRVVHEIPAANPATPSGYYRLRVTR